MSRRLLALNVLLAVVALLAVASIARDLSTPRALPLAERPRATAPAPAEPARGARPPAAAYVAVASRNLFSPARSDSASAAGGTAAQRKPYLHGVVLMDGASIAYLEDPATKRVVGYRVGDTIAGATVQAIAADHVVLSRPEGPVDVRLRDPSKPRPAVAGQPAVAPAPGAAQAPGAAGAAPQPGQAVVQPQPVPPSAQERRQYPPSLLRRPAPSQPSDATTQPR
ncbi:MAG: hypothetical protein HY727_18740 [Candidatus Rokubacteria bacterium]|nr:hypothetical protein [Candidatus Rokubacteria bacterium]